MNAGEVYTLIRENMLNFSSILEEPYSISEEQHKIDLEHLNKNVNNEFFYFVMDIPTAEISNIHGTHLWLGYPDNTFNLKHYIYYISM